MLEGERTEEVPSPITEQDDAGFLNIAHGTLDVHIATKANRLEMERGQNGINGGILMFYKYLGDEIVCFKERTIHVSVHPSPRNNIETQLCLFTCDLLTITFAENEIPLIPEGY